MALSYVKKIETARGSPCAMPSFGVPLTADSSFLQYPEYWEILELAPFKSIYPDSDFKDINGYDNDRD